jgi:hypothetical protein
MRVDRGRRSRTNNPPAPKCALPFATAASTAFAESATTKRSGIFFSVANSRAEIDIEPGECAVRSGS